jgi:DDE superfamily endonuclease
MEDVLSVYARPYDPLYPVVCVDEGAKELRSTPRGTLPMEPGQPIRLDYEYERHGKANLFVAVEPLTGWRSVRVTERHTRVDFAEELRFLVDLVYPDARQVVLVTDNLNIHSPACLYEAFPPSEARRIAERIEWHYTPEHGSWLNIAEIELSVLHRQCLDRRIEDVERLTTEIEAWETERNQREAKVHWQFTTADARIKLRRLYPQLK